MQHLHIYIHKYKFEVGREGEREKHLVRVHVRKAIAIVDLTEWSATRTDAIKPT